MSATIIFASSFVCRSWDQSWNQWEWTCRHKVQDSPAGARQHRWVHNVIWKLHNPCEKVTAFFFSKSIWINTTYLVFGFSTGAHKDSSKKIVQYTSGLLWQQFPTRYSVKHSDLNNNLFYFFANDQLWSQQWRAVWVNFSTPSPGLTSWRKTTKVAN